MEVTLFRCEGANDAIDHVYNRRQNRVGRGRQEAEEECCEEEPVDQCNDDIYDLVENDELSWAVDGDDGMSERARNPFIHYKADVDDEDSGGAKSAEDARAV